MAVVASISLQNFKLVGEQIEYIARWGLALARAVEGAENPNWSFHIVVADQWAFWSPATSHRVHVAH